jgi:hypothetical protein
MALPVAVPDIVLDTQLEVEIQDDHTIYFQYDGGDETAGIRPERRPETWRLDRNIGAGGFGTVWLETCLSGSRPDRRGQSRAVKRIQRRGKQDRIMDVNRELEAIGKFSQKAVRTASPRIARVLLTCVTAAV